MLRPVARQTQRVARQSNSTFYKKTYATVVIPPPAPKKSLTRRVLTPIVAATVLFYGVSVPLGFYSLRYRDFLVETIPLGEQIGDLLDKYEISHAGGVKLDENGKPIPPKPSAVKKETELTRYAESRAKAEGWVVKKGEKPDPTKSRIIQVEKQIEKKVDEATTKAADALAAAKAKAGAALTSAAASTSSDKAVAASSLQEGSASKEAKIAAPTPIVVEQQPSGPVIPAEFQPPRKLDATPIPPKRANNEIYSGPPLPIGFEPPPGYELPRPPPAPKGDLKPATLPPPPLPLVAPAVKEVITSEPILGQLASTIDNLAKFVENNTESTSVGASTVLKDAQGDIKKLAEHLEAVKKAETEKLEQQLKKQAGEYSGMLLAAEKELVERLDTQEEDWKKAFDDERKNLVAAYKDKLEKELETQQEIINQRLKEEVVAQGIEMQRRWVREVKVRVEEERGGRLAKLEELEGGIRKLERVTKENAESISEALHARKVFAGVKAVEHKVATGQPFTEELQALKRLVDSQKTEEGATASPNLIAIALSTVPEEVSSSGIASFPAIASRFSSSVAPQIRRVSLLPEHGGLLAYLTSYVASSFLFQKEGWAEGEDVVSTIARANFYLANKDLDLATREVNSLKGWPKALAKDWLKQARSHLEVKLALEIAEGAATVESLKAI
ncbi:hypothetical protein T439DRAFT_331564 [Meredithblackwellia eburnea MCA 4105]